MVPCTTETSKPPTMTKTIKLFSKSLTDTDTRKRLAIPAKILPDLPDFNGSHAVKLPLMYGTKAWPIVCSVRKNGYKKPVFSGGWRNFVVANDLNVRDELTLYKVHGGRGGCYYRVEVEKPPNPSRNHSPRRQVGGAIGTCTVKELPCKAGAPIKEEGAIVEPEPAYVAVAEAAAAVVCLVDRVVSKPPCWVFGTNLSEESSSKAESKTEMKLINDMVEPPLRVLPYYKSKEENDAMAYGHGTATSTQASGEAGGTPMELDLVLRL